MQSFLVGMVPLVLCRVYQILKEEAVAEEVVVVMEEEQAAEEEAEMVVMEEEEEEEWERMKWLVVVRCTFDPQTS
jgi:hypothetical protein